MSNIHVESTTEYTLIIFMFDKLVPSMMDVSHILQIQRGSHQNSFRILSSIQVTLNIIKVNICNVAEGRTGLTRWGVQWFSVRLTMFCCVYSCQE
jgi:hypothetical protein